MYPNNNGGANYGSQSQWTTGLFDCCDDSSSCMLTCCCPCVSFGRNAEIIDKGNASCGSAGLIYYLLCCCASLYSCSYRSKLRQEYSLPEEPCNDCCVHYFCATCALCQEHRELKNRGFDPAIGWAANAEKTNKNGKTPPFVMPSMDR
ncbi:protein PLANT CADMIUM RESISTANCE 7-like [Humulus lupulus]|uniref:protein PLANT CADMIUM RESISTANCE 7-like n=1 Tax=Humulus lupulus TaxID=3486 RepID=UPI002B405B7A|nr:protein PLANT CADMIUM RESISTANCE 7-like [Humulus lupulus]